MIKIQKLVTEESLRAIFCTFGDVVDASIKKSNVDDVISTCFFITYPYPDEIMTSGRQLPKRIWLRSLSKHFVGD